MELPTTLYWWEKCLSAGAKKCLVAALSIVFFAAVWALNLKTPLFEDDYRYCYIHSHTDNYDKADRTATIADILQSQHIHYMHHGGRSVVHTFLQLGLLLPVPLLRILISMLFVLFVYLLYRFAAGKPRSSSPGLYLMVFLLLWYLQPAFGQCVLWITGAANYLFGTLLVALFLLVYRYSGTADNHTRFRRYVLPCLMFVFGVITGWTNENTVAGMLTALLFYLLWQYRQGKKIPLWQITGLAGAICGFALMLLAPGNFVRAEQDGSPPFSVHLLWLRMATFTDLLFHFLGMLMALLAIFLFIYRRQQAMIRQRLLLALCGIALLVSVYSMLFSPTFPWRSWFGPVSFAIAAAAVVYNQLPVLSNKYTCLTKRGLLLLAFAFFPFSYYMAYKDVNALHRQEMENITAIKKAIAEGKTDVKIHRKQAATRFGLSDGFYPPKSLGACYGCSNLKVEYE
jgi:hypothetical protein